MEVVFGALWAFAVPLSVAISLWLVLLAVSSYQRRQARQLAEECVVEGEKLLALTVAPSAHETSQERRKQIDSADDGSTPIKASTISEAGRHDRPTEPQARESQPHARSPRANRLLLIAGAHPWAYNFILLIFGLIIATFIGTYHLYVPMVSTSYRALYQAYCRADAVSEILTSRVSIDAFDNGKAVNACESTKITGTALSQQDAFNLLGVLGMLQANEKSVKDLFASGTSTTQNNFLARLLVNDGVKETVYLRGTPTSALLIHLAQELGSNKQTGCDGDKGTAARTASLAVVMSQQPYSYPPYSYKGETRTVGSWLLKLADTVTPPKFLTVQQLVGSNVACFDNLQLAGNGLGEGFAAATGGNAATFCASLSWRCVVEAGWALVGGVPLISRPDDQVTDAQIASIALSWANWTPSADAEAFLKQKPVLDFMRNIASQASAVTNVRQGRIAVNFFVGVERLAILVVSSFLVLCLLFQQTIGMNDARDLAAIEEVVNKTYPNRQPMIFSLHILSRKLYRGLGRSAPRELLDATEEMVSRGGVLGMFDHDRLSRAAEHEMRIIDRGRFFFLAGLPLLPTIGFIGTVHSLIQALGIADNISRARDAVDQVTAVSDVTATLSLCFSTTFMALLALLVFAPLDLWQGIRERRFVEETERILDDKLLSKA